MTRGAKFLRLVPVVAAALTLSACAPSRPDESLAGFSAQELFQRGEFELETNRSASRSIRYFSEVERLFPFTDWSRRALIMQAHAFHRDRQFEQSRAAAQRFLDTFPGDEDAPQAAFLLAISFYDQIDEVGRDQGLTLQALQHLRRVIEEYPETDFARSAAVKFDLAFDHLAAKEMEVGRFYLRRRNYVAAINRFRVVVEDFQTTTHTPEALHRLVESYLALGFTDDARTAGAILGHNFQASPFYADSFRLLTGQGLEPGAAGDGWLQQILRQSIRGEWI